MSWGFVAVAGATLASSAYGAHQAGKAASAAGRGADAATAEARRQYDQTRADFADYRRVGSGAENMLGRLFGIGGPSGGSDKWSGRDLFLSQGGIPSVDSERYAADPAYRYAWDQTLANEKATRPGWNGQQTYFMRGNDADFARLNDSLTKGIAEYNAQHPETQQQAGPDMSAFFQSPGYQFRRQEGTRGLERSAAARGGAFSGNALKALAEFNSGLASQEFGNYVNQLTAIASGGQSATNATAAYGADYAGQAGRNSLYQGDARASGIANQANIWGQGINSIAGAWGYMRPQGGGAPADNSYTGKWGRY